MILIVGAGISGLSMANHLRREFLVLEKQPRVGGLCAEYLAAGYRFGYSGHFFHFQDKAEVEAWLSGFSRFSRHRRDSRVRLFQRFIPFPLQYHLSFLPAAVRRDVLADMEARGPQTATDLDGFLRQSFGRRLCELFFVPFQGKYTRTPLTELLARMDRGSIPVPDLASVRAGANGRRFSAGYNPVFCAPRPTVDALLDRMSRGVTGRMRFSEEVLEIDTATREVLTTRGRHRYRHLVSAMPLPQLLAMLRPAGTAPDGTGLRHVATLVVNAALAKRRRRFHWIYLPDLNTPFYRAGYYPLPGQTACYLERSLLPGEPADAQQARQQALQVLLETGMVKNAADVLHMDVLTIPVSYVLFDRRWPEIVPPALQRLRELGIHSIGRYGAWAYTSMADDIAAAMRLAGELNETT